MTAADKREYRAESKRRLAEMDPAEATKKSAEIRRAVAALPEYQRCRTLFCFVGAAGEPDTLPLLRAALAQGKRVCVPLCTAPGEMQARYITDTAQLHAGFYGLLEPDADRPLAEKAEIDFALVPCLSATKDGGRLGHGGGYYDRYLAGTRFAAALLCFRELLYPALPVQPHDVRFGIVVTDGGVYRRGEEYPRFR